jgi:hypothetical protein
VLGQLQLRQRVSQIDSVGIITGGTSPCLSVLISIARFRYIYSFIIPDGRALRGRMVVVDPRHLSARKQAFLLDRRLLAKYTDPLVLPLRPCGGYVYLAGHVPAVGSSFFGQLVTDQPCRG